MASPAAVLQVFVNANTKAATAQIAAFDKQLKGTAASANASSAAMGGKMAKGTKMAAAGFAALGAAAVVAGKQLYDLGAQFDEAYDSIRVGTGATGRELEKLKGNFRSVARTVPNDFKDVGTAIADLNTRLGLTGKPLERMAEQILHLSNITGENLESNIKSVARSFVDWEVPVSKQTSALDGLFRLSQKSGSTVSEIADNIQKFGSPLRTLGKDIEYGAALFANFERAGVNMQTTLPGLKQFIGNLAKPTENLSAQLKQLGINANNPAAAFERTLEVLGPNSKLTEGMKKNFAVAIFGKRAYADMLEAIKQGRFELDEFIDVFNDGRGDSIRKAADETYDFSENVKILGNNLKIYLEPAATDVFVAMDKLVRKLNEAIEAEQKGAENTDNLAKSIGLVRDGFEVLVFVVKGFAQLLLYRLRTIAQAFDLLAKAPQIVGGVLKIVGLAFREFFKLVRIQFNNAIANVRDFGRSFRFFKETVAANLETFLGNARRIFRAFKNTVSNNLDLVRAAFRGVSRFITSNWQKAWGSARGIVRGAVKAITNVIKTVKSPVRSVFQGVVEIVKDKFGAAYRAAASFVNKILGVIDSIPGVNVGRVSVSTKGNQFGEGSSKRGPVLRKQRGGILQGGSPSGDSIPAMLERGEYVLNREAVKKIGVKRLNHINFKKAPRFQKGGAIGLQGGGYLDTLTEFPAKFVKPIKDAGTMALNLLMNGPGQFLKLLPKPNLPEPITELGPYLIKQVTAFIRKNATSPLKDNSWVDSNTFAVARFLASKFNASISSSYRSPAQNAAVGGVPNSSHTRGTPSNPGAFDFVPPSGGMQSFAGKNIAGIVENMIHDVGSGLHNHIAFFQRGGPVGMRRGGWVKTGYTVFDDPGGGYRGHLQQGRGYAELGTATQGGIATGRGFIAQALGMSGELRDKFPLDVLINGRQRRMFKRDRGYGQGTPAYSIDIYKDSWGHFGLNANSKGKALVRRAVSREEIRGVKKAARAVMRTIRRARRRGGSDGFLDAAKKNAQRAFRLAGDGDLGAARDRLAKARRQIKRAMKARQPGKKTPSTRKTPFISGALAKNASLIERLDEQLELTDRLHSAEFSEEGSEKSAGEIQKEIDLLKKKQAAQIKRFWMLVNSWKGFTKKGGFIENLKKQLNKAKGTKAKQRVGRKLNRALRGRDSVASNLVDLIGLNAFATLRSGKKVNPSSIDLGGALGETNFELKQLGFTGGATSGNDSEIADLLRQQLEQTQRALAIQQAQMPVFQQFMPRFHQGGIVQGPMGAERPVMAQAGEGIFTRDQMRAMGSQNITVVIEDAAIDSNRIRVEVDGVIQDKVSTVRRQGSNRKFVTSR